MNLFLTFTLSPFPWGGRTKNEEFTYFTHIILPLSSLDQTTGDVLGISLRRRPQTNAGVMFILRMNLVPECAGRRFVCFRLQFPPAASTCASCDVV